MNLSKRKDRGEEGRMEVPHCGSPWDLKVERSWVFPFVATPSRIRRVIRTEHDRKDVHQWGMGLVMLVRYSGSPVGAYDELLFGLPFRKPHVGWEIMSPRRLPVIYVSSEASVRNGRVNWGIRKELADFNFKERNGFLVSSCEITVKDKYSGELLVASMTYTLNIPIPVHLGLLGLFNPPIIEREIDEEGEIVRAKSSVWLKIRALGFGMAKLTMTIPCYHHAKELPRLSPWWFGAVFGVSMSGTLIFPKPTVLEIDDSA